jgi:hypothetical protein
MPNLERRAPQDDLEIAARVMDTVERQIGMYRLSLEKVRLLRQEFVHDRALAKKAMSDPEALSELLIQRGIPENIAYGMVAEDFQDESFASRAGFWTWDCCCSSCCLTSCNGTLFGVAEGGGRMQS